MDPELPKPIDPKQPAALDLTKLIEHLKKAADKKWLSLYSRISEATSILIWYAIIFGKSNVRLHSMSDFYWNLSTVYRFLLWLGFIFVVLLHIVIGIRLFRFRSIFSLPYLYIKLITMPVIFPIYLLSLTYKGISYLWNNLKTLLPLDRLRTKILLFIFFATLSVLTLSSGHKFATNLLLTAWIIEIILLALSFVIWTLDPIHFIRKFFAERNWNQCLPMIRESVKTAVDQNLVPQFKDTAIMRKIEPVYLTVKCLVGMLDQLKVKRNLMIGFLQSIFILILLMTLGFAQCYWLLATRNPNAMPNISSFFDAYYVAVLMLVGAGSYNIPSLPGRILIISQILATIIVLILSIVSFQAVSIEQAEVTVQGVQGMLTGLLKGIEDLAKEYGIDISEILKGKEATIQVSDVILKMAWRSLKESILS